MTSGAPSFVVDNQTYSPSRFRAKANVGWDKSGWSANARVNFANSYTNTADPTCTSNCTISSWTTVDLGLSYAVSKAFDAAWLGGTRLAITATNIFNRPPPFVSTGQPFLFPFYYDPVNAKCPLAQLLAVTFTKRWGAEDSR